MTITGPAAAAPTPDRHSDRTATNASLVAALQRDLHLTAAQVTRLLAAQAQTKGLETTMSARLGADYGGAWFDQTTGKLVVTTTRSERTGAARSASTDTRVVKHSLQALTSIKNHLDAVAKQDKQQMSAATSWAVDVVHNQVVVNVRKGQAKTVSPLVAGYGDAVRVEETALNPTVTADFLDGGDPFNGCSVGFNVARDGVGFFLTAGHCGSAGQTAQQAGVTIGPFVQSFFPDFDDALVRNDNPGFWIQGPWVFAYDGNPDDVFSLSGFRDSPVGTPVCKSGKTTGLTCGTVTVKDESVNVSDANGNPLGTVNGLTRHSACVELGDSGGSNFSSDSTGNFAEGMTSAALLSQDSTGRARCQEVSGGQNVSWFFPVADSIAFYGVTLMTI
jgi:streptogrisin C